MSFAAPAFLWLGLLAAVILLLHTRRQRRRVVGSLQIWRKLQATSGARRNRQWPPLTLPLILQLAALAAVTLALAQPYWSREPVPQHLVVILDTSGAMAVREGDATRLDLARQAVIDRLDGRDTIGPARVTLISAGVRARFEAARWPWQRHVLDDRLAALSPSDGPADWARVAALLPSVVRTGEQTRVLLGSIGPVPADLAAAAATAGTAVDSVAVGTPRGRPALTARVTAVDAAKHEWKIDGEALLPSGEESAVKLVYTSSIDTPPLPWSTIPLKPGTGGPVAFTRTLELPGSGILTLELPGTSAEDVATANFVLSDTTARTEILYLGASDQPLLRALQSIDGVDIFQADTLPAEVGRFALVVVDGVTVPRQPETSTIWIGQGRIEGEPEPAPVATPDPDSWDRRHPLARDVDWSGIAIASGYDIGPLRHGQMLLGSQGRPLVEAWSAPEGQMLRLAFDPAQSNWPDHSSFAIFAAAIVEWLGQRPGTLPAPACTVGSACNLDARWTGAILAPAEDDARPLTVEAAPFVPDRAGLFHTPDGGLLAVNALPTPDPAGVEPGPDFALPGGWAVWLVALAAMLIAAESVIAARRMARPTGPRWPIGPLGLAAVAVLLLALLNPPLPGAGPAEAVVLVTPPDRAPVEADAAPRVEAHVPPVIVEAAGAPGPGRIGDAAAALALAAAMLPDDRNGRIVLGGELDSPVGIPGLISERRIAVDRTPGSPAPAGDVAVRDIDLPARPIDGDAVRIVGLIDAAVDTEAQLEILQNGRVIASRGITLTAGANRTETVLPSLALGETLLEIAVEAPGDPVPQNNRAGRILSVGKVRPIAVIAQTREHAEAFSELLRAQGLETEVMSPGRAPQYIDGWLNYGGIVMLNVPAIAMSVRQQELLETAVREHGLGALILGGPNSFGPGGYFKTPLEEVSPLSSRVPRDAPEVAMLFVLDRSGSMQQRVGDANRLDVAKHATVSAIGLLNPESQIGIIVFDEEPRIVLPMGKLDIEAARQALSQVDPGGGTSIFPALGVAADVMLDVQSPARHLVVMTDGLSQPGDFPSVLKRLSDENVTVSGVAIGDGADVDIVHAIAQMGGGSAHATADFEALPSILSQEAMLLSAPIEEGRSQPRWRDTGAAFLEGMPNPMPPIEGFILTTAKPGARLALSTPDSENEDMPLMAWWRYGNGFALALTTDATGLWTERWHGLDQYATLWARALREFQPGTPPGHSFSITGDHDRMAMVLNALDKDGEPVTGLHLTVAVSAPGTDAPIPVALLEEAPGHYRADTPLAGPGRYEARVDLPGSDEALAAAFHHDYSAEFDFAAPGGGAAALLAATGGQERALDDALANQAGLRFLSWHGWRWLALGELAVFMADLIGRYTGISMRSARRAARQGANTLSARFQGRSS